MESRGTVIEIVEKKGKVLAAFDTHDGLFMLESGNREMLRTLNDSRDSKREVVFRFRDDLSLVSVAPVPGNVARP